jgi:hypothetical protein
VSAPSVRRSRVKRVLAVAALTVLTSASAVRAGWEFRDYITPLGDKGTGIFQDDSEGVGATFVFACDGDRWRRAGLLPTPSKPLKMASAGKLRYSFVEGFGPAGVWEVDRLPGDLVAYEAPQPTAFVAQMVAEERKNPEGRLRIELLKSDGKRTKLYFALKGLGAAIKKNLWEPCKLDVYFGDPDNPS